jgi:glycosyltransferase involved in cell wall biosynthesis
MKLITFTVPCYNSAAYMDHCIETLLTAGEDAEIILVDDGSKDDTGKIADAYAEKYPTIVRVIHQENGGHGEGVNQGIRNATGVYFKVVDSDDWLDTDALQQVLAELRAHLNDEQPLDLMMANYVYEHVADNTQNVVDYKGILPEGRVFTWKEIGKFPPSKNILMHSVIYRTEILRACGMELPKHTFYVDNIFVYQPLPQVKTIYYMNLDLYRYFIGREDQSVNEANMIKRVDQQLRVTRIMMNVVDVYALPPEQAKLRAYMLNYFSMMMAISSIFLTLDGSKEALATHWEHAIPVYRNAPHVWNVGGQDNVASFLLDTGEGLILIDTGLAGWAARSASAATASPRSSSSSIKEVLCVITMLFCSIWTAHSPTPRRAF